MSNVLVLIVNQFLKRAQKLVLKDIGVNIVSIGVNNLCNAKLDIRNVVFRSLDENGDDVLTDLGVA